MDIVKDKEMRREIILDNYQNVMEVLKTFFNVISPFLIGIFIAYLLYMPSRKFEKLYGKSKIKFIAKNHEYWEYLQYI